MKVKKLAAALLLPLLLTLCAFTVDPDSSIKDLTKPYIATYECTLARLGDEDILKDYEYIKITFLDDKNLEVSYRRKDGVRHSCKCGYAYDEKSGSFEAETGVLGYRFRQTARIEKGSFTIAMPVSGKVLIMKFCS